MIRFNIENYLYTIDKSFALKSDRDKMMIFIMIFAGLFSFSYLLFWESSEISFDASHQKAVAIENDLDADQQYLEINPIEKIAQIEQATTTLESDRQRFIDYNEYIKNQLEQISSLYYDKTVWGAYLDSVSKYAHVYNIKLEQFGNTLTPDNSSFGHVMDITISTNGSYKNTLKFINALEQSQLVVDLHDINMSTNDTLKGTLHISVWGVVRQ